MQSQNPNITYKYDKMISYLSVLIISSISFFMFSIFINNFMQITISKDLYLTFHVFLEIASALVALSIFIVLFFTYDIFHRKYSLILANTFFITGVLDIFHMLTYKGMYNLFPQSIQTPTYFWIYSRFVLGIGLFISYVTKKNAITSVKKGYSLFIGTLIVFFIFFLSSIYVDYMPKLIIPGSGLTNTKIISEYLITAIFVIDIFLYIKRNKEDMNIAHTYMLAGLILGVFAELCFMMYINVYDTLNLAGHILKIVSYGYIFRAVFVKNVRRPYEKIFEQKELLTVDINDLYVAMEEKTAEIFNQNKVLEGINDKLNDDLNATSEIQQAMFPKNEAIISDLRFDAQVIPCEQLSGDYINYFNIGNDNVGFYIMDVSGHGVAAAMLGVFAAQSIGESMRKKHKGASAFSPAAILNNFYSLFNESSFPDELHIVMLYGMYNKKNNKIILSSAGLNCKPILVSQDGRASFVDIQGGFPICKLGDIFEPDFIDYEIDLKMGEKLILYTDGLTEMRKNTREFWGADSFLAYIQTIGKEPSFIIKENIKTQVEKNISKSEQEDDITFCIIEKLSM